MMPTALSRAMALKKAGTLPTIGSVLISAGSGFDECELCGNFFEISESSRSAPIEVPCVDTQSCYAHFTCPKLSGDRAQISSSQLDLDANDTIQWQSLADSQIESPLDFQDRYVAFYGADTKLDDDTILDTGSPMREEDDETTAMSELSDEDLREALILANNRIGTNFNIQEIEDEIPLAVLRRGTKTQLADILTQLCTRKASESDEDDGREAPKTLPPIAKQNLILTYLHNSRTAHSIKELEKALPSVASINGMQVKDYLQALSDESKIRVEKIGSGNWYWSFLSEEKKSRDNVLGMLKEELAKVEASLGELEEKLREASEKRGEDDEGRGELVSAKLDLEGEVGVLRKELEGYKDGDPREVETRRKEIKALHARAELWTDNIGVLEGYMLNLMGGDKEKLVGMKSELYGDEYVEGEGLKGL